MLGGFLVSQESPGRCTKRLVVRGSSGSSHCPQLLDLFLSELLSFHRADGLLLLLLPPPTPVPSFAEDFQKLAVFPVSIGFPAFLVVSKVNGVHLNYIVATQDKGRNLPGSIIFFFTDWTGKNFKERLFHMLVRSRQTGTPIPNS